MKRNRSREKGIAMDATFSRVTWTLRIVFARWWCLQYLGVESRSISEKFKAFAISPTIVFPGDSDDPGGIFL